MTDLVRTTLELVSIPSPTGEEQALADHLERWARETLRPEEVERRGNALILQPCRRGGRPLVGLVGHIDTVPPAPDQPLGLREGRVHGCGASDMKAGLALIAAALEERERWAVDLVAVFYDREEGPHGENGLEPLLPRLPAMDLAVVLEPTANRLESGCLGGIHAHLHFSGQRAHSARPWQGENALYRALPVLERLRRWEPREVRVEGLPFYEVMTPTMAWTENAANVVPERFTVNLNFRFAPGRTREWAERQIRRIAGKAARVEVVDYAPPGAVVRDHPLVNRWVERCDLPVQPKQAWTDVARLSGRGIPAVNFGPGDPARAHQADEWVEVAALERGYQLLAGLLEG